MISEGIDTDAMRAESDAEKGKMVPTSWYIERRALYRKKLESL